MPVTVFTLPLCLCLVLKRGLVSLIFFVFCQCKLCSRDGTIQMIPGQGKPLTEIQGQSGLYTRLMIFDCRGFEPVQFSFADGWMAESVYFPSLAFQFKFVLFYSLHMIAIICLCFLRRTVRRHLRWICQKRSFVIMTRSRSALLAFPISSLSSKWYDF